MVTLQEWEVDVENTKKEIEAYEMIARGYKILANLPENIKSGQDRILAFKAVGYHGRAAKCKEFLERLLGYGEKIKEQEGRGDG